MHRLHFLCLPLLFTSMVGSATAGDTKRVSGTALIERVPQLAQAASGWSGTVDADGRHLLVRPETRLLVKSDKGEQPLSVEEARSLGPNWFVSYKGALSPDGTVAVESATFTANTTTEEEQKFRANQRPVTKEPDYTGGGAGQAKLDWIHKARIVADKTLADHVARAGESVIPRFQQSLPDSDAAKIPFRFYVVESRDLRVRSFADGTVLVPEKLLKRLDNEAQLAALLSSAVAGIVEEQELRAHGDRVKYRTVEVATLATVVNPVASLGGLAAGEITGIGRNMNEWSLRQQTARLGLEYMMAAGYDIRQAPRAFKVSYRHRGGKSEARYIEKLIAEQYGNVDYTKLRVGEEEYRKWKP